MSNVYQPNRPRYRRNLPHWQEENAVYFVTFRLKGSLPQEKIEELQGRREIERETLIQQGFSDVEVKERLKRLHYLYFGKFDSLLDKSKVGSHFLTESEIAKIITNAIMYFDEDRYKVIAYIIMSNHVHLIFYKLKKELDLILGSIKKFSSRDINVHRNLVGQKNWQGESFDHIIRDRTELAHYVTYTLENPVKAKLVRNWRDWPFVYIRPEFEYLYQPELLRSS